MENFYEIYKEVGDLKTFREVAKKHGHEKKYPYAVDMVARYIYGDNDTLNLYYVISRGEGGRGHSTCFDDGGLDCNRIMLDYENRWREYLDELNEEIANLPLKNGETVKDWF